MVLDGWISHSHHKAAHIMRHNGWNRSNKILVWNFYVSNHWIAHTFAYQSIVNLTTDSLNYLVL